MSSLQAPPLDARLRRANTRRVPGCRPLSNRLARVPGPSPPEAGGSVRREETVEALTVAFGQLRRGAAALKAENLRAEIEALRPEANGRNTAGASAPEVGRLAEIELPIGFLAPGAARMVIDHCLTGGKATVDKALSSSNCDHSLGRKPGPQHECVARDGSCLNNGRLRHPRARRAAGSSACLGRPRGRMRRDHR